MDLLSRVRRTIERHHLAAPGTRVVAAVSGGSDSVALAALLHDLDRAGELQLVGLAHFNHQLRGAADDDEALCTRLAARLDRPFLVDREDVGAIARREHRSVEDAARAARYRFFDRARATLAADVVALGHTSDDQAETFLLRLLRGAGSKGLGSMHPRRDAIIRPLLECRRSELRGELAARELAFADDESNADIQIPRNRVRAELVPFLERFNPSIVEVLADEATLARDEHAYLSAAADALWPDLVCQDGLQVRLDADRLKTAPPALARLVVQRAMTVLAGKRVVAFADVERVLAMAADPQPAFDAPGQRVERIRTDVVLTGRPAGAVGRPVSGTAAANFSSYSLSIPGEVTVAEIGWRVSAEVAGSRDGGADTGKDAVAVIQLDKQHERLAVRNRRPGDRFRPLGLGQRKKLQDFFVDRKVARERRDFVPIVVDEDDRIVWVAGYAIDEQFRVTDPAQTVIILRLKAVGGSD